MLKIGCVKYGLFLTSSLGMAVETSGARDAAVKPTYIIHVLLTKSLNIIRICYNSFFQSAHLQLFHQKIL